MGSGTPIDADSTGRMGDRSFAETLTLGGVAGAASALAFTVLHAVVSVEIWFATAPMVVAGVVSGACLAATYQVLVPSPTAWSWALFCALWFVALVGLAVTSMIVHEPVTTLERMIAGITPPGDLIAEALPTTVGFALLAAIVIARTFRATTSGYVWVALSISVVFLLLGLNVSMIGLVEVRLDDLALVGTFFGMVIALDGTYALTYAALRWSRVRLR